GRSLKGPPSPAPLPETQARRAARGTDAPPLESRGALLLEQTEAVPLLRLSRGLPLALQLDPEAQLVLRVGVADRLVVGDHAVLVEIEQRLVERLHAEPVRLGHDLLDGGDLAAEDQIANQRRREHDLHRRDPPHAVLPGNEPLRAPP